MRPPAIRYPLFWLLGMLAALLGWRVAWPATAPWRQALEARWRRVVEGPPVPASDRPQLVAGPMRRRVLLLREDVEATDRPGGRPIETIGRRLFADIYDTWPAQGPPTHYRIGVGRPFGWVEAAHVLPWSTRLVAGAGPSAPGGSPVVAWHDDQLEVLRWSPDAGDWTTPSRRDRIAPDAEPLAALLSRSELSLLLRRLLAGEDTASLRLRALLGDLATRDSWTPADLNAIRAALPPGVAEPAPSRSDALARLSELHRTWTPDVSWSNLEFRAIPLEALP